MSSLSLIPFVSFPDKVLDKVHIRDPGFLIGCIVGKEGCELCRLGILFGHSGFFEGVILFPIREDTEGLDT